MFFRRSESLLIESGIQFENSAAWWNRMTTHVAELAKQLTVSGMTPFAPLSLIVFELEDILCTLRVLGERESSQIVVPIPRDTIYTLVQEFQAPVASLVNQYFLLLDQWKHISIEKQVQLLATILDVMDQWAKTAQAAKT
jgi:hypothetical protein